MGAGSLTWRGREKTELSSERGVLLAMQLK